MEVIERYGKLHYYIGEWEKTAYFCPSCGIRGLWWGKSHLDCEAGYLWLCSECRTDFYGDGDFAPRLRLEDDVRNKDIIRQLLAGQCDPIPTDIPKGG